MQDSIKVVPIIENTYKTNLWVLYYNYDDNWDYIINSAETNEYKLPIEMIDKKTDEIIKLKSVGFSVIDRYGNESEINYKDID